MIANHRQLSDREFLKQLEHGIMHPELFNHEAHIRMAWLYLTQKEINAGLKMISTVIRTLDNIYAGGKKYHHTITMFFSVIIFCTIQNDNAESWEEFVTNNAGLSFSKKN